MAITIRSPPTSAQPRERMGDATTAMRTRLFTPAAFKPARKKLSRSAVAYPELFSISKRPALPTRALGRVRGVCGSPGWLTGSRNG